MNSGLEPRVSAACCRAPVFYRKELHTYFLPIVIYNKLLGLLQLSCIVLSKSSQSSEAPSLLYSLP
jgi:hypothetical protein